MASPETAKRVQLILDHEQVARKIIQEENPTLSKLKEEVDRRKKLSRPKSVDIAFVKFTEKILGVLDEEDLEDGNARICDVNWTLATTRSQLYEDEKRKRSIVENTDPEVC